MARWRDGQETNEERGFRAGRHLLCGVYGHLLMGTGLPGDVSTWGWVDPEG